MKVLVAASSAFPRWTGDASPVFVYHLCLHLRRAGADIAILVPHHPGSRRFEVMDGMRVHRFRYFVPSSAECLCYGGGILPNMKQSLLALVQLPFLVVSGFFSLWAVARKERPDVLHAHWILPQGLVAVIVGRLLRIPVVVTAHAGDVFPLHHPLFRMLSGAALAGASAITANSRFTKAAVAKLSAGKRVAVIPMGVDIVSFSSASRQQVLAVRKRLGVGRQMVLSVGRLAEKKGVRYLLEAFPLVLERFPTATLVVVGDGPERQRLEALASRLRLERHVIFTGKLRNDELPAYYRAADVFVLPSIVAKSGDTEGLGVVLLEAIAAGTPVVASHVGGIPDVVLHGKTGLLVPQQAPKHLADAITDVLHHHAKARRLAAAARKHVEKGFAWPRVSKRFSAVYRSLQK